MKFFYFKVVYVNELYGFYFLFFLLFFVFYWCVLNGDFGCDRI